MHGAERAPSQSKIKDFCQLSQRESQDGNNLNDHLAIHDKKGLLRFLQQPPLSYFIRFSRVDALREVKYTLCRPYSAVST